MENRAGLLNRSFLACRVEAWAVSSVGAGAGGDGVVAPIAYSGPVLVAAAVQPEEAWTRVICREVGHDDVNSLSPLFF